LARLLTDREVVAALARRGIRRSVSTLASLRSRGGGPPFQYFNRDVRYPEDALEAWIKATLSEPITSTADRGKRG
jgi:hypothetical protein